MLKRKVIAQNITNLTDARYFAAWGVDYLSFNISKDSPFFIELSKAQEIIEWVEGPLSLIESNAVEFIEGIDGHILSNIFSSLPLNKEAFFRTPMSEVLRGLPAGKYIIQPNPSEVEALFKLDASKIMGCDIFVDAQDLGIAQLEELPEYGLVLQGGAEEKVGVKSFDELDVIYEWLLG